MDWVGAFLIASLIGLFVLAIAALADVARTPADAFYDTGMAKGWTVLLLILTGGIGALAWFCLFRRRLDRS